MTESSDVAMASLAIADARSEDGKGVAEQLVSLVAPGSYAADRYRGLRQLVDRKRKERDLRVIAVTSPGPGDGKSVTTLNLAGALAQAPGARIIVIDADLRKPSVAQYLGLSPLRPAGLVDALQDESCPLPSVVRRLQRFNLSVVPAGAPQESPYELLNSSRLESIVAEARRQYDCVVIDTPPIVPLPDCRLIERWVDGLLMVVAAHRTPRERLVEALTLVDPAKVVGVVFNEDDRRARGYGYYYR